MPSSNNLCKVQFSSSLWKNSLAFLPGQFQKAINLFDWEYLLNNLDVNEPVSVFSETVMNIRSNFVPNELIGDPPWVNRHIKNFIVA